MELIEKLNTDRLSKRGGARIGAGRKPKMQHEARELFNMAIDDRWPILIAKMDQFIEDGDKDMIKWMVEQRIGRPVQSVAVKKVENTSSYSLFYNPEIRKATTEFEDRLKEMIILNSDQKK